MIGDFFSSSQFVISNFIIFSTKIAGTRPGGGMNELICTIRRVYKQSSLFDVLIFKCAIFHNLRSIRTFTASLASFLTSSRSKGLDEIFLHFG